MEEQRPNYPAGLEDRRKELADYVISQGADFVEQLGYVVEFLHNNFNYMKMLSHAESLRGTVRQDYKCNLSNITDRLDEKELPIVREYIETVVQYAKEKTEFQSVKISGRKLIRLIPIPDTARIPPDSVFFEPMGPNGETLADAMEIV